MLIYDIRPPIKTDMNPANIISDNRDIIESIERNNFEARRIIDLRPEVNNYIRVCERLNKKNWKYTIDWDNIKKYQNNN